MYAASVTSSETIHLVAVLRHMGEIHLCDPNLSNRHNVFSFKKL